jgi:hypothetical protein
MQKTKGAQYSACSFYHFEGLSTYHKPKPQHKDSLPVRRPGKTRGAFGFALIFLLHFLHQGKKWKEQNRKPSLHTQKPFPCSCFLPLPRYGRTIIRTSLRAKAACPMNTGKSISQNHSAPRELRGK